MPQRPLLILPQPALIDRPKGAGFASRPKLPSHKRQIERLDGRYSRLKAALEKPEGVLELRNDPTSIAPERAIVFEIAGRLRDFYAAVGRIEGLSYLGDEERNFEPDGDFAVVDLDGVEKEKKVPGRRYLAMPTLGALRDLVGLYERWKKEEALPRKFAQWRDLFNQLKDLRPWGPTDRITDETILAWRQDLAETGDNPVRIEVEFWFQQDEAKRRDARRALEASADKLGGRVLLDKAIPDIAYHGALVDVPADQMQQLIERAPVELVLADQAMFLRPQAMLRSRVEQGPAEDLPSPQKSPATELREPIAALLDAVPQQNHTLLAGRVDIDDRNDLQAVSLVDRREHGTEMASLIIHGDLGSDQQPLPRLLHIRPIMFAPTAGSERTDRDELLIDTIYQAILRMKEGERRPDGAVPATAPNVFIVNISMGDRRRPYTGPISPWARLLDHLAEKFRILFLVSAGNITEPLELAGLNGLNDLENAEQEALTQAVLNAMRDRQASRSLLSPAEALNPVSVGACHDDASAPARQIAMQFDPFAIPDIANVSSALGLGHRRSIKPDILMAGGRERLRFAGSNPARLEPLQDGRVMGVQAASIDSAGLGRLDQTRRITGTSAATALASRAAHQIFDVLMDRDGGSNHADMEEEFWAVVTKSMLVHGARWSERAADLVEGVFGPLDASRHEERRANISRVLGYGRPEILRVLECSPRQATLLGYGSLFADQGHSYDIPLPACLAEVKDPRSLVITLAWLSPISTTNLEYRRAQLCVDAPSHRRQLGVERFRLQPGDKLAGRGTIVHEIYQGNEAVPFIDDGNLSVRVWCLEKAGRWEGPIRYGLAITIEAGTDIPVYDQVDVRLRELVRGTA